jgi:acyl-CoA synthetase (AMP-forming)/AMP-acid ligase II
MMPEIRTLICMGIDPCPSGAEDYEALISATEVAEDAERGGDDLYAIFFTGGTTGFPNGVMLSHDNLMVSTLSVISTGFFLTPRGRILHAAPMFHLDDIGQWIGGNLLECTHYFMDAFCGAGVARSISENHVTDVLLVPTMIQMVLEAAAANAIGPFPVSHVVYGASPITDTLLQSARAQFSEAEFTQAYGDERASPRRDDPAPRGSCRPGFATLGRARYAVERNSDRRQRRQ